MVTTYAVSASLFAMIVSFLSSIYLASQIQTLSRNILRCIDCVGLAVWGKYVGYQGVTGRTSLTRAVPKVCIKTKISEIYAAHLKLSEAKDKYPKT
jgi:hypothetical protein